jgi:cytochrome P450
MLIFNFMGAAFDTTINAIGSIIWLLATNPSQWDALRGDPSLVPSAVNEGMRRESPLQIWGRFCRESTPVDGATVPEGTRVAVMIGSANRDERHYPDPDRFDVRRNPGDHLGFGQGIHLCVGAPLARIEIASVLGALVKKVRTIELAGDPVRRLSNTTRGFESLPVAVS